tara:strand:+ start:1100 stop:1969 length:870 start_codon:yes stop_codon:yes gene_type:complete
MSLSMEIDNTESLDTTEGISEESSVGVVSNPVLLEIKTVQSSAFRILIEALKEILTDANIECDSTGMKIIALDASHTVLVHMKLEAGNFEQYYCPEKQVLGISMLNFFKLIKTMGNCDTLTLYIEKNDVNHLGIKVENGEKNSVTDFKLNLMDLPVETISIPPAEFDSVITMPSNDFQKTIRDMHILSDIIEIRSVDQLLIFRCEGDFATQETKIGQTHTGLTFLKNTKPTEIVQGLFALKYLVLFTKCTNLCNSIEMYLKNDYPIIIKYSIASLGSIKLCLAPQVAEE